ncbi:unnamed protein product [Allacma fusca]|uniref:Uncharacterized protein n=1 Tax=Allacma fusca TaxID=39272 RepID=A0A8J2KC24_9HEXA|nr:unnamed protein product [Allacma fusca]
MTLIHVQAIHRPRATQPRQMFPNPMHPPRPVPSLMSHCLPAPTTAPNQSPGQTRLPNMNVDPTPTLTLQLLPTPEETHHLRVKLQRHRSVLQQSPTLSAELSPVRVAEGKELSAVEKTDSSEIVPTSPLLERDTNSDGPNPVHRYYTRYRRTGKLPDFRRYD